MTRRPLAPMVALLITATVPPMRPALGADDAAGDAAFRTSVAPLLTKYCGSCHGPSEPKGELDLTRYRDLASILDARRVWETVLENVEGMDMPPAGKPRPTDAERATLVGWLQAQLTSADCSKTLDPGRVVLRRLNRSEYNNTVRDLTGVDLRPGDDFPSDDVGYGFDNIGDVLSLPPILFEKYMAASEKIAEAAIALDEPDRGKLTSISVTNRPAKAGNVNYDGGRLLATLGEVGDTYDAPADGDYFVTVRGYGQQAGPDQAAMEIRVDGKTIATFQVAAVELEPGRYEAKTHLKAGKHAVAAVFTNDWYDPTIADPTRRDRNLVVQKLEAQGPAETEVKNLPRSHKMIVGDRPKGMADAPFAASILERFASRAYRRTATRDEVDRLVKLYTLGRTNGESFERAIQLGVQATLMSPHFLFKVEQERTSADGAPAPLGDFELATRLSYFLWSSMPDAVLLGLAASGKLQDDATLEAQARRMLKDRKSRALTEDFAGQWLQLRNLKNATPDPKAFPEFDDSLKAAMLKETESYFSHVKNDDRSILEFLDSDYTFLNRRLARFYRAKGFVPGKQDEMVKTTLVDGHRGGILTHASVLTVTSNPTRTSPVKRGKYILEQVLNTPPPPPPPDVPELKDEGGMLKGSLRRRMEQHRAKVDCAGCHARMDPLGFGLENFDAIGAWRDKDGDYPIDATGTLPSGRSFDGPQALRAILIGKSDEFTRCLVEKMMTYAMGRGLDYHDRCAVDRIADAVAEDGHRFGRLIVEIVKSEPFRKRRPKGSDR